MMIEKKIIAVAIFLAFLLPTFSSAEEKATLVFDPSKVEISDDQWEEVSLGIIGEITWCGDSTVVYREKNSINKHDVRNGEKNTYPLDVEKGFWIQFYGCSPDGSYLFARKVPMPRNKKSPLILEVYETKTMRRLKTLSFPKRFENRSALSPDGRFIPWFKDGEIVINENYKVKLLPVFNVIGKYIIWNTWSFDSKKLFLISPAFPNQILLYDVEAGKLKRIKLLFEFEVQRGLGPVTVHPDGGKIYFSVLNRRGEYEIDLTKIDWSKPFVKPTLFMERSGIDEFNKKGDMLFTAPSISAENGKGNDLFLMEKDGRKIKRLRENFKGSSLKISRGGKEILFGRSRRLKYEEITDRQVIHAYETFVLINKETTGHRFTQPPLEEEKEK